MNTPTIAHSYGKNHGFLPTLIELNFMTGVNGNVPWDYGWAKGSLREGNVGIGVGSERCAMSSRSLTAYLRRGLQVHMAYGIESE